MRVVAICGMGFGTSLLMKMTIDDIFRDNGIKADLQAWDLGSAKGQSADIIVAPQDMKRHLDGFQARIVLVSNLTDKKEIEAKLMPVVRELLAKD